MRRASRGPTRSVAGCGPCSVLGSTGIGDRAPSGRIASSGRCSRMARATDGRRQDRGEGGKSYSVVRSSVPRHAGDGLRRRAWTGSFTSSAIRSRPAGPSPNLTDISQIPATRPPACPPRRAVGRVATRREIQVPIRTRHLDRTAHNQHLEGRRRALRRSPASATARSGLCPFYDRWTVIRTEPGVRRPGGRRGTIPPIGVSSRIPADRAPPDSHERPS